MARKESNNKTVETTNVDHLLKVDDLSIYFQNSRSVVKAVDKVSIHIDKGETVSVIGESGSGKTTLGKAVLSLIPHTTGKVTFDGRMLPSSPELKRKYGNYAWMAKNMQMIFQDPYSSLHPTWSVYKVASQGLRFHSSFQEEKEWFKQNKELFFWREFFKNTKLNDELEIVEKMSYIINVNIRDKDQAFNTSRLQYESEIHSLNLRISAQKIILRQTKKDKNPALIEREQIKLEDLQRELKDKKMFINEKFNNILRNKSTTKNMMVEVDRQLRHWELKYKEQSNIKEGVDSLNSDFAKIDAQFKAKLDAQIQVATKENQIKVNRITSSKEFANEEEFTRAEKKNELKNLKHALKQEIVVLSSKNQLELQEAKIKWIETHASVNPWLVAKKAQKLKASEYSFKNKKVYIYNIISKFLEQVGLAPAMLSQPISDLSGGQRQRIAIARALVMNAKFIVADEPISALDVSIQAQVINILNDMKEKLGLTIMFIAHDLRMVRHISDRIYIIFKGKIVESGETEEVFTNPMHPYTRTLLSAIPSIDSIEKGFKTFNYDLKKLLSERDSHELILVDGKDHYVHGTPDLIKKWKVEAKDFTKEFNFD